MIVINVLPVLLCLSIKTVLTTAETDEKLIYLIKNPTGGSDFYSTPLSSNQNISILSWPEDIYTAIICDPRKSTLYFVTKDHNDECLFKITNATLDGQIIKTQIGFHRNRLTYLSMDIRYDWITGNLYGAVESRILLVIHKDNSISFKTLVEGNDGVYFNGLALNPNSGLMYWARRNNGYSKGPRNVIMQGNMDGTNVKELVSASSYPKDLTLDLVEIGRERLYYYTDENTIESVKLDGTNKMVISVAGSIRQNTLNIYRDQLLYVSSGMKIKSIDKFTGLVDKDLPKVEGSASRITVCDMKNQPNRRANPCEYAKCSDACILSSETLSGFLCVCQNGKLLDFDELTCIEPTLAISFGNNLKLIRLDLISTGQFETMKIPELEEIHSFVYNPNKHSIILYDSILKKIFEYDYHANKLEVLVDTQIGKIEDLDIDEISQNLYWIDSQRQTLEVLSLVTKARKVLRVGLEKPTEITVDPGVKMTHQIFITGKGYIMTLTENGAGATRFTKAGKEPSALTYDLETGTYFWIEGTKGFVMSTDSHIHNPDKINTLKYLGPVRNGIIYNKIVYWVSESDLKPELRYTSVSNQSSISQLKLEMNGKIGKIKILKKGHDLSPQMYNKDCSLDNQNKNKCSHICFEGSNLFDIDPSCACPEGYDLEKDGLTCKKQEECYPMPTQFKCNDGNCISSWFVCDKINDCLNGEDEAEWLCEKWNIRKSLRLSVVEGESSWGKVLVILALIGLVIGGTVFIYKRKFAHSQPKSCSCAQHVIIQDEGEDGL